MKQSGVIALFDGTVSVEIKQSINSDFSAQYKITRSQSSSKAFNINAGKDGFAASFETDEKSAGISAL